MPNLNFIASRDKEGVPKLQKYFTGPFPAPIDLILHFFVSANRCLYACQIWSFYLHPFQR